MRNPHKLLCALVLAGALIPYTLTTKADGVIIHPAAAEQPTPTPTPTPEGPYGVIIHPARAQSPTSDSTAIFLFLDLLLKLI